jgi:hypothetical protein
MSYRATAAALGETGVLMGTQGVVAFEVEGGALNPRKLAAALPSSLAWRGR